MKAKNVVLVVLTLAVFLFVTSGWNNALAKSTNSQTQGAIRYVLPVASADCSAWTNPCNLQTALSLSQAGDQIWVAAGIHKPTTGTDRTISFNLENGVAIYGGFPTAGGNWASRNPSTHLTTLSGDIGTIGQNSDNSYRVVVGIGVDASTIVDGFTISGGNANGSIPYNFGGGMSNESNSSPTLINLIFSGNSAIFCGGLGNNSNSNPTLTKGIFFGNSAQWGGGICNASNSNPTLANVTFSGNNATSSGGGMFSENSSPTLNNVTFSGNSAYMGGGMLNYNNSSPNLTNVTFSGNAADYGGGIGNTGNSSPILTNVTIFGNSADTNGGGIYNYSNSNPTLTNTIIWGNNTDQIFNDTSLPTVTYSDVMGGYAGEGNINQNPLLSPLANYGGFTMTHALVNGSPAIDTGDPGNCPTTDQRNYVRPVDGDSVDGPRCDMGAYEYGATEPGFPLYLPMVLRQ